MPLLIGSFGYVVSAVSQGPVRTDGVRRPFFPTGKDTMAVVQGKKVSLPADVVAAVVETVFAVRFMNCFVYPFCWHVNPS